MLSKIASVLASLRERRKYNRWRASLTRGERARLDYWGATGNPEHYDGCWK